ncbi:MAG: PAS domain-containing protein [Alphaproteobacteria bacterium]|nr:PAS domain-containing protein [Alphaproteobacteria bacterium]
MAQDRSILTGKERRFAPNQFIVSKTNAKGIITYANDVFLDIAGYTLAEVLGKPHNIIRHPAMPRCVFKLLWDRIGAGHEVFAYVINRAKCGDHYWVLAHVTPSYDAAGVITGYHSNRRLPDPEIVNKVAALYAPLRAMEDQASTAREGVQASVQALQQWVADNGGNYDAIIHSL